MIFRRKTEKIRDDFLETQEKLLQKQKGDLEKELSLVADKKKTGQKYRPKFLDFGQREDDSVQEVATYEEYLVLEKNLVTMLAETNRALKRLKKGKYEICERCREPINRERLKVMPTASLCVRCINRPARRFRLRFWKR